MVQTSGSQSMLREAQRSRRYWYWYWYIC